MSSDLHPGIRTRKGRERNRTFAGMSRFTAFLFMFACIVGLALGLTLMTHPLENWFSILCDIAFVAGTFFFLRKFSDPMDNQFYAREVHMIRTLGTADTLSCGVVTPHVSPRIRTFASSIRFNRSCAGR